MKRKDMLAAGARSATFAGGIGENDILRNVAPEGSRDESVPIVETTPVVRKKFRPMTNVLLVRRQEVTTSSVLITDTMEKEKPSEGVILEVGRQDPQNPHGLVVGDHVVFGKYSGAEFKLNGETLILLEASEIKGTIVDESVDPSTYEDEDGKTWMYNVSTGKWDIPVLSIPGVCVEGTWKDGSFYPADGSRPLLSEEAMNVRRKRTRNSR